MILSSREIGNLKNFYRGGKGKRKGEREKTRRLTTEFHGVLGKETHTEARRRGGKRKEPPRSGRREPSWR
jgi:hypothetical protein